MSKKYKTILIFIGLLLIINTSIGYGYIKYKSNNETIRSQVSVIEGLSINYLDGEEISSSKIEDSINFSIINLGEDSKKYNIYLIGDDEHECYCRSEQ